MLDDDISRYVLGITSLQCSSMELLDFMTDPDVKLDDLDSASTPLTKAAIVIKKPTGLTSLVAFLFTTKNANIPNINLDLMKKKQKFYLPVPAGTINHSDPINVQVESSIVSLFQQNGIGHMTEHSGVLLVEVLQQLTNALCFFISNWQKLLHKNFPFDLKRL
ncbi:hypothetical protein ACA910_022614 [Epithemia clementina (nom. ined.)]